MIKINMFDWRLKLNENIRKQFRLFRTQSVFGLQAADDDTLDSRLLVASDSAWYTWRQDKSL